MPPPTSQRSESGSVELDNHPEIIDITVFEQILEMDDDPDDREFSKEIVQGFFEQAEQTLEKMNQFLAQDNLAELSSLGHFLKGSSATLGLVKVQKSCEKIQNFGKGLDATGNRKEPDESKSLQDIRSTLRDVDGEYHEAKDLLNQFFKTE